MAKDREIERLSEVVRVLKLSRVCVCAYVCVWGGEGRVCVCVHVSAGHSHTECVYVRDTCAHSVTNLHNSVFEYSYDMTHSNLIPFSYLIPYS